MKCFSVLLEEQPTEASQNVVCENGVCKIISKDEIQDSEASSSSANGEIKELTPEEKVQRAKELIEEKKKEKEMEEKEVSSFFLF